LNYCETVEDRWVYTFLQALNAISNHVKFIAIVPGAYTGQAKMWNGELLKFRLELLGNG